MTLLAQIAALARQAQDESDSDPKLSSADLAAAYEARDALITVIDNDRLSDIGEPIPHYSRLAEDWGLS